MAQMTEADFVNVKQVLEVYGEVTTDVMKDTLKTAGKNATGNLINSIRFSITYNTSDFSVEFDMIEYGQFVDQGRLPGKQPPIASIRQWAAIKGIDQKAAFPIARKIGKIGIKATPFFQVSVDKQTDALNKLLEEAYAKDVDVFLQKQINSKF